jgi:hypothetical protein
MSAVGSIQQGKAAKQAADYQAAIARNQAIAAQQKAEYDAAKLKKDGEKKLRFAMGKSGVVLEGAPLLVAEENAQQLEEDVQMLLYGGRLQAQNFNAQAGLNEFEGRNAKSAGYGQAFGTILTGFGSTAYSASKIPSPSTTSGSIPTDAFGDWGR